jgi:uncharacterized protein (TIGR03083 family)
MSSDTDTLAAARDIPMTPRADACALLDATLDALDRQLGELTGDDAGRPTDCSRWDVRDMIAHVVASTDEAGRFWLTPGRMVRGRRRYPELARLDARNELQTDLYPGDLQDLRARLRELRRPAVAGVRRLPRPLDRVRIPSGLPGVPPLRLGYLMQVIIIRDTWAHGVDLAEATGKPRVGGGHDTPIIGQVVRDLAIGWSGPAIDLTLTGPGAGRWLIGGGTPVARVEADAVQLSRLLAGRPAGDPVRHVAGDPAAARTLTGTRVLF